MKKERTQSRRRLNTQNLKTGKAKHGSRISGRKRLNNENFDGDL